MQPLQHRNDLLIHTTLFVATCAPLFVVLGIVVATLYYWRKKKNYGEGRFNMRKQGRGYWMNPADVVERKGWAEMRKNNAEPQAVAPVAVNSRGAKSQSTTLCKSMLPQSALNPSAGTGSNQRITGQVQPSPKRVSFFKNPYDWIFKAEEPGGLENFERAVGRSDAIRTCNNDGLTLKGVVDIWLSELRSTEYDGRRVRKKNWIEEEEMEMAERRVTE
jgi:hypothetical protein